MTLTNLLDDSITPAYVVNAAGQIVYGNQALRQWVGLAREALQGRRVEYHSEPVAGAAAPLTGLCPPPSAYETELCEATLSTLDQSGKLRHRRARFVRIASPEPDGRAALLGILDPVDLTPQQLQRRVHPDQDQDTLHRDIRRFRREHREPLATALLLGDSPAAHLLRSQVDLAQQTRCGALVVGECIEDAATVARAIHYAQQDASATLVVLECQHIDLPEAQRLLSRTDGPQHTSVLVQQPASLPHESQLALARFLSEGLSRSRLFMTACPDSLEQLSPELRRLAGPLRIDLPSLAQRTQDLPMIAQYFVERLNSAGANQREGFQPAALDRLALYDWPGGVGQLADIVQQARAACSGSLIGPGDLPPLLRHAASAAGLPVRDTRAIELDAFLQTIERELIHRALDTAEQNKA
ncbi:MAG: hypothetical protein KDA37_02645, partial [Planctomycetales bacterium]|nr:hypothetical protein [Planctomycetales bacterium]